MWGALFDERTDLSLTIVLVLARAVILGSESRGDHDHIYCLIFETSQPGRPGPRIYIPQDQGGPVTAQSTGLPFRRLLRLAGLRWRYSNPPPRGSSLLNFL
jgi:hypothetical protein